MEGRWGRTGPAIEKEGERRERKVEVVKLDLQGDWKR